MEKMKYKKYQAARESNPAFTLNQIGKIALNRAKNGERYQYLEIITAQLMCAFTMEAVLNHLGKKLFEEEWEEEERRLTPKDKLKKLAERTGLDIDLESIPFRFFAEIFKFRDSLVHAKSSKHFSNEIPKSKIDENGFPMVDSIPELSTDWEKLCSIDTAEEWRKAVDSLSDKLSDAAKCPNPIHIGDIIDTWGELES